MSHLLGPSNNDDQLNLLGTCLQGGAREWFYRNVEHPEWEVRQWTFESAIQGLQRRFLHTLTQHHTSNKYESAMQDNQTVHELLNDLRKYAGRMIMHPDAYMFRKRFILALCKSLCQEILKRGLSPERSTIEQLYKASNAIEEATRYNQGTRRMDSIGNAQSTVPRVMVPKMTTLNQPVWRGPQMARMVPSNNQYSQPVNIGKNDSRMTTTTTATKPPPQRGGNPTQPHMISNDCNPTHQYLLCYKCGQTGHIKPN